MFSLLYDFHSGYANVCGGNPAVVGSPVVDRTLDIEVKVMRDLLQRPIFPPCNEGVPGFHVVHGIVLGPDGERYRGNGVMGHMLHPPPQRDGLQVKAVEVGKHLEYLAFTKVEPDGTFAIAVPEGASFVLIISAEYGAFYVRSIGWYGVGGFTTDPNKVTRFKVMGSGISGIVVRLPADPADLPQIERIYEPLPAARE